MYQLYIYSNSGELTAIPHNLYVDSQQAYNQAIALSNQGLSVKIVDTRDGVAVRAVDAVA